MKLVKFTAEYSHQINEKVRKSWPAAWPAGMESGEVEDDVAFGARRAEAAQFAGETAEADEAWFAEQLKEVEAEEKARAKAAEKAARDRAKAESDPLI
jgi:hypothetical protein